MFLWNDGLQRIGSVNAMLLLNLMPIVTFAIRALEGARFEAVELAGAAIVVGSLMANNLMLRRGGRAG
jgi:drug/metabolite transporter (DMT)-like permease